MFAGFSVGGVDWPKPELLGVTDPLLRREIQTRVGFEEAGITRRLGGNMLRVFFRAEVILGDAPDNPLKIVLGDQPGNKPVYSYSVAERLAVLDDCDRVLDRLVASVARCRNNRGAPLSFEQLDDYLAGVERYNAEQGAAGEHVWLLLTLVV